MQNISTLLKNIQEKKTELQNIAETISLVSGVLIIEKDMHMSSLKGYRKLRLNTSGSKRTILALKKDSIQEKLTNFGITLVL